MARNIAWRRLAALPAGAALALVVAVAAATALSGCWGGIDMPIGPDGNGTPSGGETGVVRVEWFGHATFRITSPGGVRVLTDPYPGNMGYGNRRFSADMVTVSHEHFDHNSVASVEGDPEVLRGLAGDDWASAEKTMGDLTAYSVDGTYHDNQQGRTGRGKNSLFVIETAGLRFLHLGDLGDVPPAEVAERVGSVDVLFLPVGGFFTIDATEAARVADLFKPRVIIPMHYRTAAISDWQITTVEPFLEGKDGVRRLGAGEVELQPDGLPETTEIWVFEVQP